MPALEVKRWLENIENEHKIQERISFLANIVETSNQPFCAFKPNGEIILCNKSFCDLFNYSIEDLKGISLSLFMSNKWYEVKKLINKLSAGETVYLEKEHTRIDGTIVSLEIFIQSINGEDGSVLYYYVFMNDIK